MVSGIFAEVSRASLPEDPTRVVMNGHRDVLDYVNRLCAKGNFGYPVDGISQ